MHYEGGLLLGSEPGASRTEPIHFSQPGLTAACIPPAYPHVLRRWVKAGR
jgi:hypothetical protein